MKGLKWSFKKRRLALITGTETTIDRSPTEDVYVQPVS